MLYRCRTCGKIIREDDLVEEECYLAEAWGRPVYETYYSCPKCGEDVEEYYGDEDEEDIYESQFKDDD